MKRVYVILVALITVITSIFAQRSNTEPSAVSPINQDIARNVHYLTSIEKDVVLEINKVRLNPKKYANEVIVPILETFIDNPWNDPLIRKKGDTWLSTNEGKAVVYELIEELKNTTPMQMLYPSEGMSQAAKWHTQDCSSNNRTGHDGSDGSQFWDRVDRYGKIDLTQAGAGECLSYGENTGVDIVVQLLIDDGVENRGHRKILLNPNSSKIGVGYGTHPEWNYMCTVELAYNYSESE